MLFSPLFSIVLVFVMLPFVLSIYALLFSLNQSTFSITIKGYKSPYIKVRNENGYSKVETDYGWFGLQHDDNATTWEFKEQYIDLPYEMYKEISKSDHLAIDDAIKRLKVLEPQDGEGTLCLIRPCRVVTHHEVYETIKITGKRAFGSFVADSVRIVERVEKEAPYDRYTLALYQEETLASIPVVKPKKVKPAKVSSSEDDENVTRYDLVVNQCIYAKRDADNKIIMKIGLFNIKDAKYLTPAYNVKPYIKMREGYDLPQEVVGTFLNKVIAIDANATGSHPRKIGKDNIYVLSTPMDYQLHLELKTINNKMMEVTILNHMRKPCPAVDLGIGDTIELSEQLGRSQRSIQR